MGTIGLETPRSELAHSLVDALKALDIIGLPAIIRPSFTLGGTGGGIAYNREEFLDIVERGLDASPTAEVLIEESVLGWKEFEMEVVRDRADNCIIVCSIENIDPMGVHTGDSITVAPALTLTDKEFQIMRDASIAVLREIGVETGGSNVQFAVNPADGRLVIIEMNPRVSRSSALASKATGFPIAKVAAKLAVGYTLDELDNDITGGAMPASFEPTIDYVVTKIPRFAFEKFPGAEPTLTTSMKSVGEVMAIGRTFAELLQKALRGARDRALRPQRDPDPRPRRGRRQERDPRRARPADAGPAAHLRPGDPPRHERSRRSPAPRISTRGSCASSRESSTSEAKLREHGLPETAGPLRALKAQGFSDARLAAARQHRRGRGRGAPRAARRPPGLQADRHLRRRVRLADRLFLLDLRGARSPARRPTRRSRPTAKKVMILGGGPNRIGQGIEFDYCCCHACFALSDAGYETIMVNCNPETVSTDYDTSDRLYFEPLTAEDVLEIVRVEQSKGTLHGVIVQLGGQTPLKLAAALAGGEGADPRHLARHDRPRRGPRPLPEADRQARPEAAEERHRLFGRAGAAGGRRPRLPAGGPPVLRARRPGDADHPRGGAARRLPARHAARAGAERGQGALPERQDRADQHAPRQEPAALRPLPVRRDRGRRRRARRRQGRLRLRHHGAHRGGRHPFRRLGLLAAAAFARRRRPSPSSNARPGRWRWPSRSRA